jgi:3-deoxy-7-phosphoheptulonate synthase
MLTLDRPSTWTPDAWRARPAKHIPEDYPDLNALDSVEKDLRRRSPLVFASEIRRLTQSLGDVARGEAFFLQGGDCAESFAEFHPDTVRDTFRVLMQMAAVLTHGAGKPVVKAGRIAGQFAKPRSKPTETRDGITLPSYRGDSINAMPFDESSRTPDPDRLLRAYDQSASTLALLRALATGGYASLRNVHAWMHDFLADSPRAERYQRLADQIAASLDFLQACGIPIDTPKLNQVDFYTSHEALLLNFEEALTRRDAASGQWFTSSAHMVWIGDRTRQPDGAHVAFCAGISNPIGIKCGPSLEPDDLMELLDRLNPGNAAGRIVLITRFGADKAAEGVARLMRHVRQEGRTVVWSCDPMHGNTFATEGGFKTRAFDAILQEIMGFFDAAEAEGVVPGGVHLEMTGQNVTECLGGTRAVTEDLLGSRYHTHCDPRLNADQALEVAFLLAERLRDTRARHGFQALAA